LFAPPPAPSPVGRGRWKNALIPRAHALGYNVSPLRGFNTMGIMYHLFGVSTQWA